MLLLLALPLLVIAHRLTRDAHLAHFAQVDAKTGLHNSRHFESALEEELAHSHPVRRAVAVMFADLDHFKRVNDEHGHAAGDRVLREVASILTDVLRKGDTIAKIAAAHKLSPDELARLNGIAPNVELQPGQEIKLPSAGAGNAQASKSRRR